MKIVKAQNLKLDDLLYDRNYYAPMSGQRITGIKDCVAHIEIAVGVSVRKEFDTRTKYCFHPQQAVSIL